MARYADSLLSDGETIALRARQHWLATLIDGRAWWALLVVTLVLAWVRLGMTGTGIVETGLGWLVLGLLALAALGLGRVYWAWYAQDYIVTNRRVLKVEGILNKRSADSSLEKINDAVLEQNLIARILGYGDLDILTAADVAVDRYRMLARAATFKKTMLDQKHRLDSGRDDDRPGGSGGDATVRMTADEVDRALASLTALRDRGAISSDDFEEQKRDLLRRL